MISRARLHDERGAAMILFAVILPLTFILAAAVWDVGNWWVHRKHLQTKVDAAAFAGGGVWGFPCGDPVTGNSATIESEARKYFGPQTTAAGTVLTTGYNPQVGGAAPAQDLHVVLNGTGWYDNDSGSAPADRLDPANPSICDSKTLDVKATEDDTDALFGWLPFFPDIKRKARVEIQDVNGLSGLLPLAVRVPKPLSAAAVFYDEATGDILDGGNAVRYFCEDQNGSIFGLPAGLGGWSTYDPLDPNNPACSSTTWLSTHIAPSTGVVVATSFRPACGTGSPPAGPPCLDDSPPGVTTVNDFCRQASGTVQCFFTNLTTGTTQTVESGLQFIRGYDGSSNLDVDPPLVRSVWLDSATPSPPCSAYFNSDLVSCSPILNADIDLGSVIVPNPPGPPIETRTPANTEVRYKVVYGPGINDAICDNWQPACDMAAGWSASFTVGPQYARYSVAIRVRLKNTIVPGVPGCSNNSYSANCEWYFTSNGRSGMGIEPNNATIFANPLHRTFMGDIDRSGPIKWLRLTTDSGLPCDLPNVPYGEAASQTLATEHCFYLDIGFQGGLALDQDEPPIALNLGTTSSDRAILDCDPDIPNLKDEIVQGCGTGDNDPAYAANKFVTNPFCPNDSGVNQFFSVPKPPPFDMPPGGPWPPYRCVLTQDSNSANQILPGFQERFFPGQGPNPVCPTENASWTGPPAKAPFTPGRNYWHDANNQIDEYTFAQDSPAPPRGNRIGFGGYDPRLVTLFFTPYDSFSDAVNDTGKTHPIVTFGNFYITGYGRIAGGSFQNGTTDPCTDGNSDPSVGAGSKPPPDLDYSRPTMWVWGHFVKEVTPNPFTLGGSGVLCEPVVSFQPCVAVLVE